MIKTKCDVCGKDFFLNAVDIKSKNIILGNAEESTEIIVEYFICPHCSVVYKVNVKDELCNKLHEDMQKVLRKINKNKNQSLNENLIQMYKIKKQRFDSYSEKLNKLFSETFTLVASENNHEDVKIVDRKNCGF